MTRSMTALLLAASLGLAACGERADDTTATETNETADNTATMEGGGVYPSPTGTLAVEPMASDPARNAVQNEARNKAPDTTGASGTRMPSASPSGMASAPAGR